MGGLGGSLNYPLLSDLNKKTARDYGILLENEGVALRGLFLIGPDGIIMHSTINSLSVGRSVSEAMRVLKAFQFVSDQSGAGLPGRLGRGEGHDGRKPRGHEKISRHPLISDCNGRMAKKSFQKYHLLWSELSAHYPVDVNP